MEAIGNDLFLYLRGLEDEDVLVGSFRDVGGWAVIMEAQNSLAQPPKGEGPKPTKKGETKGDVVFPHQFNPPGPESGGEGR